MNNWNNSTAIGYNSTITASNQIVLGTTSENVVISGNQTFRGIIQIGDITNNSNITSNNYGTLFLNSNSTVNITDNHPDTPNTFAVFTPSSKSFSVTDSTNSNYIYPTYLQLPSIIAHPTPAAAGMICLVNEILYFYDGTSSSWLKFQFQ